VGLFRQDKKLFDAFEGEADNFKEQFFLVRSRTEVSLSNVLNTVERPHAEGGVASTRVALSL